MCLCPATVSPSKPLLLKMPEEPGKGPVHSPAQHCRELLQKARYTLNLLTPTPAQDRTTLSGSHFPPPSLDTHHTQVLQVVLGIQPPAMQTWSWPSCIYNAAGETEADQALPNQASNPNSKKCYGRNARGLGEEVAGPPVQGGLAETGKRTER